MCWVLEAAKGESAAERTLQGFLGPGGDTVLGWAWWLMP